MEVAKIQIESRSGHGRRQVSQLRGLGKIPAVIYGGGAEPVSVTVSEHEFEGHLRHHHRVFETSLGGKSEALILQSIQWESMTDRPLHVDFRRIDLSKPIEVPVEFTFLGHPAGAAKGGRLVVDHNQILLRCLPAAIPDSIEVNVEPLDLNAGLTAKDIVLPPGVELAVSPDTPVCHVALIVVQAVPEAAPAPAEGEAAAAGGEAAPAAPAGGAPAKG